MKKALSVCAIALAASLMGMGSAAAANAIEEKNLENGKESIKPDMGYIFLTAPDRFAGSFIRVPDDEDVAKYEEAREAAFTQAMERYEKDHARWGKRMAKLRADQNPPEEPVKPAREEFPFVTLSQFLATSFGPTFVYSKGESGYSYLEELKPGTYIWYGPVFYGPKQGFIGQCYCMGTIKFEVAPGVITNLGNSLFAMPRWEDDRGAPTPTIKENSGLNGFVVKLPEQSGKLDYDLPGTLAEYEAVTPEFFAVGKINNFYGQMIARIAPIDGVIAYERDQVIDVKAQASAGEAAKAETPANPAPIS